MKKMLKVVALAVCLALGSVTMVPATASADMTKEEKGAVGGGVAGAAVGAIIGQAAHESVRATLGGAAIGLVPGAIVVRDS